MKKADSEGSASLSDKSPNTPAEPKGKPPIMPVKPNDPAYHKCILYNRIIMKK